MKDMVTIVKNALRKEYKAMMDWYKFWKEENGKKVKGTIEEECYHAHNEAYWMCRNILEEYGYTAHEIDEMKFESIENEQEQEQDEQEQDEQEQEQDEQEQDEQEQDEQEQDTQEQDTQHKNYASLLNQIMELYIKAQAFMYYWDKRYDDELERGNDTSAYCAIRNQYAHEANAYYKILKEEVSQEDIANMRREAEQTAISI